MRPADNDRRRKVIMVFDTSVLIELSCAGVLEKLANYKDYVGHDVELVLPDKVLEELMRGKGTKKVEGFLKRTFMVLRAPEEVMREIGLRKPGLGPGELSVLAVATSLMRREPSTSVIAIIDDRRGRKAAEELGLERHGTLWLIIQLKARGIISRREAMEMVEGLPARGFHLNGGTLKRALKKIESDC